MSMQSVVLIVLLGIALSSSQVITTEDSNFSTRDTGSMESDVFELSDEDPSDCPPWFLPSRRPPYDSRESAQCFCADTLRNIVQCDDSNLTSYLSLTHCMTYDESSSEVLVGACPYSYFPPYVQGSWIPLTSNASNVTEYLCKPLNRKGLLCGKCMEGYGISVHLTGLDCVDCTAHPYGGAWFFFTEIVLQTLFFLFIFFFRINVTSAKLSGFLLSCQLISSTNIDRILPAYLSTLGLTGPSRLTQVFFVFYKFWVLEFFTGVLPPACLHRNITMLNAVALGYVSAFYPFLLILLTFVLVRFRDCNFKLVTIVWRPYRKLCLTLGKYIDLHQSLIHTFSGVIVLSYSKLALVSYSLLFPIDIYNVSGVRVHNWKWYHDAEVKLFSSEHVPYAFLALVVLLFFVVAPPLLLVLYPFKWFQILLHKLRLDHPGVNAFMDSFQGCYKNGTTNDNGTSCSNSRDLRYFAALYFVLRLLFIGTRLLATYELQWRIITVVLVAATIIFSYFQPYKKGIFNIIDIFFLCFLFAEFFLFSVFITNGSITRELPTRLLEFIVVLGCFPLVYFIALLVYELAISVKVVKKWRKSYCDTLRHHVLKRDEEMVWPHRLAEDMNMEESRWNTMSNVVDSY